MTRLEIACNRSWKHHFAYKTGARLLLLQHSRATLWRSTPIKRGAAPIQSVHGGLSPKNQDGESCYKKTGSLTIAAQPHYLTTKIPRNFA